MPSNDPDCVYMYGGYDAVAVEDFCTSLSNGDKCCTSDTAGTTYSSSVCGSNWDSVPFIKICRGACQGIDACVGIGLSSSNLQSVQIGENGCQGDFSCNYLAGLNGERISVGDESCQSLNACRGAGFYNVTDFTIGTNSCTGGDGVCYDIGVWGTFTITMGNDSCFGTNSCRVTGRRSNYITMGDNVCVGTDGGSGHSCYLLGDGFPFPTSSTFEDGACNGDSTPGTNEICQLCTVGA